MHGPCRARAIPSQDRDSIVRYRRYLPVLPAFRIPQHDSRTLGRRNSVGRAYRTPVFWIEATVAPRCHCADQPYAVCAIEHLQNGKDNNELGWRFLISQPVLNYCEKKKPPDLRYDRGLSYLPTGWDGGRGMPGWLALNMGSAEAFA